MSRREEYLNFLYSGQGDLNKLPFPVSPEDFPLYEACKNGIGTNEAKGFYRCKIHNTSTSAGQNFIGSFIDLGANAPASVKIKAKVTVRQIEGTALPTQLGLRLFANNIPEKENTGSGYQASVDNLQTTIQNNTTYTIETEFNNSSNGKSGTNLETNRYLKPFISITRPNTTDKHCIDVHEVTIEVNNIIYDITDTIYNFMEGLESDFKYITAEIPAEAVQRRKAPLFGKKLACLGDSITFGYDPAKGNENTALIGPWRQQLKEKCGFLNVKNYGLSGRMFGKDKSTSVVSFVKEAAKISSDADVITIMGGINDFSNKVPLGSFTTPAAEIGSNSYDTTTFYGAVQTTYELLKKNHADKLIVAINLLNGTSGFAESAAAALGVSVIEAIEMYRAAIRTCANYYGIPCLEIQEKVSFDALIPEKAANIPDKVHPNQAGHDEMAKAIADFINNL